VSTTPTTAPVEEDGPRAGRPGTIVVGVDGSEASLGAVRWAYRQAELTGAHLRAVMSWDLPNTAYWVPLPNDLDLQKATEEALDRALREAIGDKPVVPLSKVVVEGHPAPVLLQQAEGADLLVVASRGHGEFTGMLLGSVSEHCVTHATCPVVVVRAKPTPRER
jgi:nucleotide-binding universal stress UspA family protein